LSLLDAPEITERRSVHSDTKSRSRGDDRLSSNGRPGSALSDAVSSHVPAMNGAPGITVARDHTVRTVPGMGKGSHTPRPSPCNPIDLLLTLYSLDTIYAGDD
jgi:hypothetical protein